MTYYLIRNGQKLCVISVIFVFEEIQSNTDLYIRKKMFVSNKQQLKTLTNRIIERKKNQ